MQNAAVVHGAMSCTPCALIWQARCSCLVAPEPPNAHIAHSLNTHIHTHLCTSASQELLPVSLPACLPACLPPSQLGSLDALASEPSALKEAVVFAAAAGAATCKRAGAIEGQPTLAEAQELYEEAENNWYNFW